MSIQVLGDDNVVPLFKILPLENKAKSLLEGRPIFDDVEVIEIRFPGSRNYGVYPVDQMSHWSNDMYSGEQRPITYAERFRRQYVQFKEHQHQTKSGTPLDVVGFLAAGRREELKSQNIYTVEALAAIDGTELKNLGPGGRELKNQAIEYIAAGKARVPDIQLQAEVEALRAKVAIMEEDRSILKYKETSGEAKFEAMSPEQLREYVTMNTGHSPVGSLNKKALIRLAMEVPTPKAVTNL
jgi:hypothetical protein